MHSEYPEGIDCAWVATDRLGHLAAFVTAGDGPIPSNLLSDRNTDIFEIETLLRELPRISEVNLLKQLKRPDDFIELAEKGIFVFDWVDLRGGGYELIAVPATPIGLESASDEVRRIASITCLQALSFAAVKRIEVERYVDVVRA